MCSGMLALCEAQSSRGTCFAGRRDLGGGLLPSLQPISYSRRWSSAAPRSCKGAVCGQSWAPKWTNYMPKGPSVDGILARSLLDVRGPPKLMVYPHTKIVQTSWVRRELVNILKRKGGFLRGFLSGASVLCSPRPAKGQYNSSPYVYSVLTSQEDESHP